MTVDDYALGPGANHFTPLSDYRYLQYKQPAMTESIDSVPKVDDLFRFWQRKKKFRPGCEQRADLSRDFHEVDGKM